MSSKMLPEITELVSLIRGPVGEPLASPLKGDQRALSQKAHEKILKLTKPSPVRFAWEVTGAWITILGVIALAEISGIVWIKVLAVFCVATRQNLLGLLVHEQTHYLGANSKLGDFLANFFCAWPLLISIEDYAKVHLAHHQFYFSQKDPDFKRKQGKLWTFPMKLRALLRLFFIDLTGVSLIEAVRNKQIKENHTGLRKTSAPAWIRIVYYSALVEVLTLTHAWPLYLFYWLLPLATFLQVIVRWGAICEHKYNLVNPQVIESTPIIVLTPLEKFLLPNLNFTLHIYHHFFPGIPFHHLPKVHQIFQQEDLLDHQHVYQGYGKYLRSLLA